jgi:hypothetical protein
VPIVGPDVTRVRLEDSDQALSTLIGQRLTERYRLQIPSGRPTMGEAVAAILRQRGHDSEQRLYRVINDIISEYNHLPGRALTDLAAITDLRLFVSTTPDRLLARAINNIRSGGIPLAREITFSPFQSTSERAQNSDEPSQGDAVVFRLFGGAASLPEYAIHEEDRLEWVHTLLSDKASLPPWISRELKHRQLLFIGCDIPDWISRFLMRMSCSTRLSRETKQFFIVESPEQQETLLSTFFSTYCRTTQIMQLGMEPSSFVTEFLERWRREHPTTTTPRTDHHLLRPTTSPTIFISYVREDASAARRLRNAITALGGDVWLDERRLLPGDEWGQEIVNAIRRGVRLFIPVISENTERQSERYVFREWREAIERARAILGRRFIVPVVIDINYKNPITYRQVPEEFRVLQFGHAPAGDPTVQLSTILRDEIRSMRRVGAA